MTTKTATKFTPGPWTRDDKGDLRGAGGEPVYFKEANARLIAAAPEMLAALEAISTAPGDLASDHENAIALVRSAIRQAKGE